MCALPCCLARAGYAYELLGQALGVLDVLFGCHEYPVAEAARRGAGAGAGGNINNNASSGGTGSGGDAGQARHGAGSSEGAAPPLPLMPGLGSSSSRPATGGGASVHFADTPYDSAGEGMGGQGGYVLRKMGAETGLFAPEPFARPPSGLARPRGASPASRPPTAPAPAPAPAPSFSSAQSSLFAGSHHGIDSSATASASSTVSDQPPPMPPHTQLLPGAVMAADQRVSLAGRALAAVKGYQVLPRTPGGAPALGPGPAATAATAAASATSSLSVAFAHTFGLELAPPLAHAPDEGAPGALGAPPSSSSSSMSALGALEASCTYGNVMELIGQLAGRGLRLGKVCPGHRPTPPRLLSPV